MSQYRHNAVLFAGNAADWRRGGCIRQTDFVLWRVGACPESSSASMTPFSFRECIPFPGCPGQGPDVIVTDGDVTLDGHRHLCKFVTEPRIQVGTPVKSSAAADHRRRVQTGRISIRSQVGTSGMVLALCSHLFSCPWWSSACSWL